MQETNKQKQLMYMVNAAKKLFLEEPLLSLLNSRHPHACVLLLTELSVGLRWGKQLSHLPADTCREESKLSVPPLGL